MSAVSEAPAFASPVLEAVSKSTYSTKPGTITSA